MKNSFDENSTNADKYEYGVDQSSNNNNQHQIVPRQNSSRKGWGGIASNKKSKATKRVYESQQCEQLTATAVIRSSHRTLDGQNYPAIIVSKKNKKNGLSEQDSEELQEASDYFGVSDEEDGEETTDGLQELDRATVRLDGIEVYAIVSALTCATSISCFDNFEPTPMDAILNERAIFTLLSELFYYASGALGMMSGLHATLIFSLVTMYGRTALGINRDDAFNEFFGNTGAARFNGFMSFKLSLYCFMTQLCFLIGKKFVFTPLRPLVLAGTLYLAYKKVYVESEAVLAAAGVIYSTPPTPTAPQVTIPEPGNLRASLIEQKRRGSKKSSCSLSTRNFGVDTSSNRMSFISSDSKTNDE